MIKKTLTPLLKQYIDIKEKYKDCLIFFRLGDFYELFFEDAAKAALQLKQAQDALILKDNTELRIGSGYDLRLYHDGSNSRIRNYNGDLYISQNSDDKDIIFTCDDGSGGTTAYLTLDGGDVSTIVNTIKVLMPNLPTSDPSVAGQLWNSSGDLKVSAG